ncbi:MAG: HAD-IA family hydrolase [Rhodomicrobium sp.]
MENTLNRCELSPRNATIVFDLDGTIADTAADLIDAANAALAAEGLGQAHADAIKKGVGYGAKAMLQSAVASLGHRADAEQLRRLSDRLVAHYEENIAVKTRLFPGFAEAAGALRLAGARLALCTNKRERLTLRLLLALEIGSLFDAVAGGDTFPFHKPDPRHILELVRLAGGEPSAAIMVGDSEADAGAARAAGIPFIAAGFGYAAAPAGELGADAVMNHFEELPALIGALLPQMHIRQEIQGIGRS